MCVKRLYAVNGESHKEINRRDLRFHFYNCKNNKMYAVYIGKYICIHMMFII